MEPAVALGIEPRDAEVVGVEPIVLLAEEVATNDLEPAVTLGIEPRDAAVVGVEPIVLVTEEGATKDLGPEALGIEPNLGGLVAVLGILYCTFFSFSFTSLAFLLSFQPLGSFTTLFATPFTSLFLYWGLMYTFLKSTSAMVSTFLLWNSSMDSSPSSGLTVGGWVAVVGALEPITSTSSSSESPGSRGLTHPC